MNKLSTYRKKAGISQARLAVMIGVRASTIGNYELEIRSISLGMCWKIIKAFNELGIPCSIEDVFPSPDFEVTKSASELPV